MVTISWSTLMKITRYIGYLNSHVTYENTLGRYVSIKYKVGRIRCVTSLSTKPYHYIMDSFSCILSVDKSMSSHTISNS